jgi:hypothetical protein
MAGSHQRNIYLTAVHRPLDTANMLNSRECGTEVMAMCMTRGPVRATFERRMR